MKVKRRHDYTHLEQLALGELYRRVKNDPKDGKWRKVETQVWYVDGIYDFSCHYQLSADFFTVADVNLTLVNRQIARIQ